MDIKVLNAEYYFITPIRILGWEQFEQNLTSHMWDNKGKYRSYSMKPLHASFLGQAQSDEFPITSGLFYSGDFQRSDSTSLTTLNHAAISFVDKRGMVLPSITEIFSLEPNLKLYVTPNKRSALVVLHLSSNPKTLEESVRTVYILHKTDPQQSPYLCINGEKKNETLKDLVIRAFPKGGFVLENDSRFTSASYIRVDASPVDFSLDDVKTSLVRLSLAKDMTYKISEQEVYNILTLFDNILASSSREGFSTIVLSKDPNNEIEFIKDFADTFEKSYLPLYLAVSQVERVYLCALQNIDDVARSTKEQDCFREARLILAIPPSQYEHLNRLMNHIITGRSFEEKYQIIYESILSRREQIELQRLQLEQEHHKLALEKKESEERRDRTIGYMLGFIGVGQVIFAILDLCGASDILGRSFAGGLSIKIIAIVLSIAFVFAIFYYIYFLLHPKQK